ncbi:MAG: hypothetical protein ACYDCK_13795 [Thermoplasmatota archaeon]
MPEVKVPISEEMWQKMASHREVAWADVMRAAAEREIERLDLATELGPSGRTPDDVVQTGREARRAAAERSRRE